MSAIEVVGGRGIIDSDLEADQNWWNRRLACKTRYMHDAQCIMVLSCVVLPDVYILFESCVENWRE
jgi:hypothetical protein